MGKHRGVTMAIWYEVEKTEDGIKNFLDSNWGFHDFRMHYFFYDIANNKVDIFLKYDTDAEGVLLRFVGIDTFNVSTERDWHVDWISGSTMSIIDDHFIWLDDDSWGDNSQEHINDIKQYATWVISDRVFWAITDAEGKTVEMPKERIHQTWRIYDKIEEKYFRLNEFNGNWNDVLSPKRIS